MKIPIKTPALIIICQLAKASRRRAEAVKGGRAPRSSSSRRRWGQVPLFDMCNHRAAARGRRGPPHVMITSDEMVVLCATEDLKAGDEVPPPSVP